MKNYTFYKFMKMGISVDETYEVTTLGEFCKGIFLTKISKQLFKNFYFGGIQLIFIPKPSRYVRALGAIYMRLVGTSLDCYNYLEPLYNDYRKIRRKNKMGSKFSGLLLLLVLYLNKLLFMGILINTFLRNGMYMY